MDVSYIALVPVVLILVGYPAVVAFFGAEVTYRTYLVAALLSLALGVMMDIFWPNLTHLKLMLVVLPI